jgi:hypothetical protein
MKPALGFEEGGLNDQHLTLLLFLLEAIRQFLSVLLLGIKITLCMFTV